MEISSTYDYIKSLEIKNFKSFNGLHIINNLKKINGIIGSNGAGKSTIIDAINELLDCDIINYEKIQEISKRKNKLETYIQLVYVHNGEEYKLKKIISENKDKYYFNDNMLDRQEYIQKLKELNLFGVPILTQANYNFFTKKTSAEMINMIEKLSNSIIYKQEYNELKDNIKRINLEIDAKAEIIKKLKKNILFDKKIQHNIKNYDTEAKELENLEQESYFYNLYYNLCTKENTINKINNCDVELSDLKNKYNETKINKIIENKIYYNINDNSIYKNELNNITLKINENNNKIRLLEKEKINKTDTINFLEIEKNRKLVLKNDYLNELEQAKKNFEKEKSKMQNNIILNKINKSKDYNLLVDSVTKIIDLENNNNTINNQIQINTETIKSLESKNNMLSNEKNKITENINKINDEIKEINANNNILTAENNTLNQNYISNDYDINYYDTQILNYKEEINQLENDTRIYSQEDVIISNLYNSFSNYLGKLEDIIETINDNYNIPIQYLLGNYLNCLIVIDNKTAILVNKYLKDCGVKRNIIICENIPVVNKSNYNEIRNNISGNGMLAYDVIKIANIKDNKKSNYIQIDNVLLFLLNNKIICFNRTQFDSIKHLLKTNKTIFFNNIIYKKGVISYNNEINITKNLNNSKGFNKVMNKLEILRNKLRNMETERDNYLNNNPVIKIKNNNNTIDKNNQRLKIINNNKDELLHKSKLLSYEVENIENNLKTYYYKLDVMNNNINENNIKRNNFEDNFNTIISSNFKNYDKTDVFDAIYKLNKKNNYHKYYESIIINLEYKIEALKINDIQNNITKLSSECQTMEIRIKEYQDNINSLEANISEINNKIETLNKNNENNNSNIILKNINIIESQKNILNKELSDIKFNIKNIESESSLNGFKFEYNKHNPINTLENNYKQLLNDISERIDKDAINSDINDKYNILKYIKDKYDKLKQKLNNITIDIKLTATNSKLLEKNKKLEQEKKITQKEIVILMEELNNTQKAFEIVKKKRTERFQSFFVNFSLLVNKFYCKLYGSNDCNLTVIIDNTKEPYNGSLILNANPPNKKFIFDTENLSLGETVLVNFSIYLTLNKLLNNGIIILDELDAHFDYQNTLKILNIIKLFANIKQIIMVSHKRVVFECAENIIGISLVNNNSKLYSLLNVK